MQTLTQLRSSLSASEREFLDFIGGKFIETGKATDGRLVDHKWAPEAVKSATDSLGGNIVEEGLFEGIEGFKPTMLGLLLTNNGDYDESCLVAFFELVRKRWDDDPLTGSISSGDLFEHLGRRTAETKIVGRCLSLAGATKLCATASFHADSDDWTAFVQRSARELKSVINMQDYLSATLLKDFSREYPVHEKDRRLSQLYGEAAQRQHFDQHFGYESVPTEAPPAKPSFAFMADTELRRITEADWDEIVSTSKAKAWKATIIMCGSVIETLLLDTFEALARANAIPLTVPQVGNKKLFELIALAETHKVLPAKGHHLADFIRGYRNHVHPDVQRKTNAEPMEVEANLAFWVTFWIAQELERESIKRTGTAPQP